MDGPADRRELLLLTFAIVLVALSQRAVLAVIGPLTRDLRAGDGLSTTAVGLLAATPLLAFGLVSPIGPSFAARFGIERTVVGCMLVLAGSLFVRSLPFALLLFAGTLVAGAAIAITNVLLPALVKRRYGTHATFMTGVYSVALGLGAALGAGLAVPSEGWFAGSWRGALAWWAAPALLGALVWLPLLRGASSRGPGAAHVRVNLWRDRIAWRVAGFMALLGISFYSLVAWLPEIYRHEGLSKGTAGALLSLSLLVGIPGSFLVGALAGRLRDQRTLVLATGLPLVAGWLGVLLAPRAAPWLWVTLLGNGFGVGFTLVLALVVLRAEDTPHAAALSGMAQSVGYTLGAVGPIAVGALHDLTGSWSAPLIVLVVLAVLLMLVGLAAGRPGYVRGRALADVMPSAPGASAPLPASAPAPTRPGSP
ncbi:MAG TPA: MFS transporter [Conexibacter sp.]|nr:MFS transporter [Conexibacter sp.]